MNNINNELQELMESSENDLKLKLVEYTERPEIQAQISEAFYIWKDDPHMIIEFTSNEDIDDHTFTKFLDWFMFDFKTFDQQKRVIELFYEEEKSALNHTESELLETWIKSYQSFFELTGKKEQNCELKEIFTGKQITVKDKNTSSKANVSEIIFARPLKTGGIYYFSGAISIYPNIFKQTILEIFEKEYLEYRKINGSDSTKEQFLRDWSYLVSNQIDDVVKHPQFLNRDGEEFIISSAKYRLNNLNQVEEKLLGMEYLKEITELSSNFKAYILDRSQVNKYYANIEIENDVLTLKCNSRKKLELAKSDLEDQLDDLISHTQDEFHELPRSNNDRKEKRNKDQELPSDALSEDELERELDNYYETWIDTPLEALGNLTPLQAMKTIKGKERLENILKELEKIYDHAKKVGEPYYDVRKLRDKLKRKIS